MKRLLFACCLLVCSWGVWAKEHYVIQHYSIKDGMSQNTVMAILQDRQGFMWFGTWDGLNRFDGYEFETFKAMSNGQAAQVNNRVDWIYEDEKEQIWWSTYDGHYYRMDAARKVTTEQPYDSLPEGLVAMANGNASHLPWTAVMPVDYANISSCSRITGAARG